MAHKLSFLALLLCCKLCSYAQEKPVVIPDPNSRPILEKAASLYDSSQYKLAIDYLLQIPNGDTNYEHAQSLLAAAYIQDSNFEQGVVVARRMLQGDLDDKPQMYINLLSAYDAMGKKELALGVLDTFQKEYPNDHRPDFERAVVYYNHKDYANAEKYLQQSVLIFPRNYRSNIMLAAVYIDQGRFAEALMALGTSLLFNDNVDKAKLTINSIAQIVNQSDEVQGFYRNRKAPDHTYDELDELIQSKIALDKAYKLKSSLEDNVVRQYQLVCEQIKYEPSNKNFVNQVYVPLFSRLFNEDKFEGLVLQMFSGYGINSVENIVSSRRGKDALNDAREITYDYFNKILGTRTLNFAEREKQENRFHYLPQDNLIIEGKSTKVKGEKSIVGYTKYYRNGRVIAEGNFQEEGKKTGEWIYYHPNGIMRLQEYYNNGKMVDKYTRWWGNGNLESEALLHENGEEKQIQFYDGGGNKTILVKDEGSKKISRQLTYKNGQTKTIERYLNEKRADGKQTTYNAEGKVVAEEQYKNEKLDGKQVYYNNEGNISSEENFLAGEKQGTQKIYYRNQKLSREYESEKGIENGKVVDYYLNGNKREEHTYKKGKLNGRSTYYTTAGTAYGTLDLNNGRPYAAKFTNAEGQPITAAEEAIRNNKYMAFYPDGTPMFKMPFDSRGLTTGKAEYYYPSGTLSKMITYKDDKLEGEYIEYYANGNKLLQGTKKEGVFEGPYKLYHRNGQLNQTGWITHGDQEGTWIVYNDDGSVYRKMFYASGERNGADDFFHPNGKRDISTHCDAGFMLGYTQYDTTGKVMQQKTLKKGNGPVTFLHYNGNVRFEVALVNGNYHGPFTTYYDNKKVRTKGNYSYGYMQGNRTIFYPNGKPSYSSNYSNGDENGFVNRYWPDGSKNESLQKIDDEKFGSDTVFFNGQPRYITEYWNGEEHGQEKIYGDQNELAGVLFWEHGHLLGYSYEGKDGKLLPMITLPKATGSVNTFYASGAKAMEWRFDASNMEGKQVLYFSNGQMAEERNYTKSLLHGPYVRYYPNGAKYYEANFTQNLFQGKRRLYNNKGKLLLEETYINDHLHGPAAYSDGVSAPITINYYYDN